MPHTPTHTDANQAGKNRGQPQPDSLENDDRGTKPYQKQSQSQSQRAGHEKPQKGPDPIGDPPPDKDDTIRADDAGAIERNDGVVEDTDPPLPTDDNGELGSASERH